MSNVCRGTNIQGYFNWKGDQKQSAARARRVRIIRSMVAKGKREEAKDELFREDLCRSV